MQTLSIPIVHAFIDGDEGGNPAGIVLNADRFDQATKQAIATQVGLSETAFVSSSSIADLKLEFFTPRRQIAQCGHATVATFSYLAQQGELTNSLCAMETVDGARAILMEGDQVFMEQTAPRYTHPETLSPSATLSRLLGSLTLSPADLRMGLSPLVVNTGNAFLIIALQSSQTVKRAKPDLAQVEQISQELDLAGYYIFATPGGQASRHATARMFAPIYGIAEEAATGMAAGPLACYMHDYLGIQQKTYFIEQGQFMAPSPLPSLLTVRLPKGSGPITGLMVGGQARLSHTLDIDLPSPRSGNASFEVPKE